MRSASKLVRAATLVLVLLTANGCMTAYKRTVAGDLQDVYSRIYLTDFNTAWQASLDALKAMRLDVSNREGGFLQTKWTENTADRNFVDSFGPGDAYLKAQYRFKVTVAKGLYDGKPSVKISVEKDQVVERDVLEGWQPVPSDSVDENTLLYRIGRLIWIRAKLAQMEEQKVKEAIQNTEFN